MYMELLIELYQEILDRSDFICQIRLTLLNKYTHRELKIYDFLNIEYKYFKSLSNDILKNYKYVKKLCATCENITDDGISHMKLHTLNAHDNPKITDAGISHMNLHTLDASDNPSITDRGISHMK